VTIGGIHYEYNEFPKGYYSWWDAYHSCQNFKDGSYQLPVPTSEEFHNFLTGLDTSARFPLGISDRDWEGIFINIYTGNLYMTFGGVRIGTLVMTVYS